MPLVPEWVTLELARREWADAPSDDERLRFLLDAAQERCSAYLGAKSPGDADPIPARLQLANIYDARDLWSFENATGGLLSLGEAAIRPPELTRTVKASLRPHRGVIAR